MSGTKKESYLKLLKEAFAEFDDVAKTVDTSGPMLDPILSYKGDGELNTHQDAASVLERYYFNETNAKGVDIMETEDVSKAEEDNTDDYDKDGRVSGDGKDAIKDVTSTDNETKMSAKDVSGSEEDQTDDYDKDGKVKTDGKKGIKDDLLESDDKDEDDEDGDKDADEKEGESDDEDDDSENFAEAIENSVIEKLIAEMEGAADDDDDEDDKEEASDDKEEEADDKEEDLDVDKELKEALAHNPTDAGDREEEELYEAFKLFAEQIEDAEDSADVEDIDSDDTQV